MKSTNTTDTMHVSQYNWTIETIVQQASKLPQVALLALPDRWTKAQEVAFIEAIFLGFPLPLLVFNFQGGKPIGVVDGQGRLKALLRFYGSQQTPGEPLEGLTGDLSYLNGQTIAALDPEHFRVFANAACPVSLIINADAPVLQNIRSRLNNGAVG